MDQRQGPIEQESRKELLKRQFEARYYFADVRWDVGAATVKNVPYPRPEADVYLYALRQWSGEGFRVFLLGEPAEWPHGWTASVPTEELAVVGAPSSLGTEQSFAKAGSRFEHRTFRPPEFGRLVEECIVASYI